MRSSGVLGRGPRSHNFSMPLIKALPVKGDYSQNYVELRLRLLEETNGAYNAFVRELRANYRRAWFDIALGYVWLLAVLYVVQVFREPVWLGVAIIVGSILIGYGVAYIQLFLHEAAHFNLAPDRRLNDVLTDAFVSWFIGTDIQGYRTVHFEHHRKLGETDDSERSYFNALTPGFLLATLTGFHALQVLTLRGNETAQARKSRMPLIRGMLIHMGIVGGLLAVGAWPSAIAWILGMGIFFPFFGTIRQILEHRGAEANPVANYAEIPHGAHTRIFGTGVFSSTFGGAGFNRHLLHHWEPQISYTRFADFEEYLLDTSAASVIESRRSTYWRTFKEILKRDHVRR